MSIPSFITWQLFPSKLAFVFIAVIALGCKKPFHKNASEKTTATNAAVSLYVLGTLQDAGSPHIGCKKDCCKVLFEHPDPKRMVVSLGVVDTKSNQTFLFEATPDISLQTKQLHQLAATKNELPDGIFLTHAHIGHYAGLMYLGKEAINASGVKVFALPRMRQFLEQHGPWSQLVSLKNIVLQPIEAGKENVLTPQLKVTPFLVPHRDEFSETVGYHIEGPNKKVLFIPDIDKWEKWETSILEAISEVDYAFIDATFFDGTEINTRDISEIPHPFMVESMSLFKNLPDSEKKKINFIHFNHTNPVLNPASEAYKKVLEEGYKVAYWGQTLAL